ncbi:MAG: flagellin [Planctomycetota bacterium]
MLAIKNNTMADTAARHLGTSYDSLSKSVERLSSGLRINSAKDDAAGLAVREMIRADMAQIRQASRNAQDAVSMLQTAEAAMGVMDDLLVRMKELSEQAATGSYSDEQRTIMNEEFDQLAQEITRIADSTTFNGTSLLDGTAASVSFHLGSGSIAFSTTQVDANTIANGASVRSNVAIAQTVQHDGPAVADTDTALYIEVADVAATSTITFKFNGGADVVVDLGGYDLTGVTLDELVTEINTEAGVDYASAVSDGAGKFILQLTGTAGVGGDFAFTAGATDLAAFDNVADFTETTASEAAGANSLTTAGGAALALDVVSTAIETKDTYRAKLGYYMNRLEAAVSILDIQAENLSQAESRISDVDVATEMAAMTRNQVLAQAGIAMLAQANTMPQMALKLLG